jgi:hypothetical protein
MAARCPALLEGSDSAGVLNSAVEQGQTDLATEISSQLPLNDQVRLCCPTGKQDFFFALPQGCPVLSGLAPSPFRPSEGTEAEAPPVQDAVSYLLFILFIERLQVLLTYLETVSVAALKLCMYSCVDDHSI